MGIQADECLSNQSVFVKQSDRLKHGRTDQFFYILLECSMAEHYVGLHLKVLQPGFA